MADAVQARIEREARFASDVSHELRSPITALAAAAEVINGRRGELPDRTQQALDVVVGQVRRFDAMVIDLLELSRIDAGATDLHPEEVDIAALCARVAARNGFADLPIDVPAHGGNGGPLTAVVDKLRFERILANLLENADHHGGGPVRISIERTDGPFLLVAVEDCRPGRRARASGSASSSASHGAARPGTASAPGSGWPSSPSTPPPRAARRGSRTAPAAVPGSSCASRRRPGEPLRPVRARSGRRRRRLVRRHR